ncbi:MAG: PD-(D/E)XK nuclease family protein, partial [Bacillota bacterium]
AAGDAAVRLERLKAARLTGLTAADPRVIRAMDAETGAGVSPLVDAGLNKDGTPRKSPRVVPREHLQHLLEFVRGRMAELAAGVLSGRVAPQPYRWPDGSVPCRYCPYKPVCRFEGAHGFHRHLAPVDPNVFWREVTGS